MNLNFDVGTHSGSPESFPLKDLFNFIETNGPRNCFNVSFNLIAKGSSQETIEKIYEAINGGISRDKIVFYAKNSAAITGRTNDYFIIINQSDLYDYPIAESFHINNEFDIQIFGHSRELLKQLQSNIQLFLPESDIPSLEWKYSTDGGINTTQVKLKKPKIILNELYPWLEDVQTYQKKYVDSSAPILILLGLQGTGKTSFINRLIWDYKLNTMFTYDAKLMESDSMFIEFITGTNDLLVVEDADLLLGSREHEGNKIMNKFLNIGDGLMDLGYKKIIFTANIKQKNHIDPALIREGRCFDCNTFRSLTYDEVKNACAKLNIEPPTKVSEYTLAEIFAHNRKELRQPVVKMGF